MKLFHVSSKYLGETVGLCPRIPLGQSIYERQGRFKNIPRICCGDTILKCLYGITKMKLNKIMYVYIAASRTRNMDFDSPRDACNDWEITEEIWVTEPTEFKFISAIRIENLDLCEQEIDFKKIKYGETSMSGQ